MLLLISENEVETYYCNDERLALETAKSNKFFNKPGDKICLIDFYNMKSNIYELGEDLIPTVY